MTPPHVWESIIAHSAILFTPTGDKALSRDNPTSLQNGIGGIFAMALAQRRTQLVRVVIPQRSVSGRGLRSRPVRRHERQRSSPCESAVRPHATSLPGSSASGGRGHTTHRNDSETSQYSRKVGPLQREALLPGTGWCWPLRHPSHPTSVGLACRPVGAWRRQLVKQNQCTAAAYGWAWLPAPILASLRRWMRVRSRVSRIRSKRRLTTR
jgi:hypothetical protein